LVTRKDFQNFLKTSGYYPKDAHNFLSGWTIKDDGSYECPADQLDLPVTSISVDEATLFCQTQGKRLPHEYEWQYAAQGNDGRTFPWGEDIEGPSEFTRVPTPCSRTECKDIDLFLPTKVGAHSPAGDAESGMRDAIGNVW